MSNYITESVSLWLDNDSNLYRQAQELANEALEHACNNESHAPTARNDAMDKLAGSIETLVCADMPCVKGLWGDLINCALQEIDWEDIARDFLSDKEIWMVFSNDDEDAQLFTEKDLAIECLMGKLDNDNTLHAASFVKLANMDKGGSIAIEGIVYTLACDEG